MGVSRAPRLTLRKFIPAHYQEGARAGLVGIKLSGGWPSLPWAAVQPYSAACRPTLLSYGLSMANETDSDGERDRGSYLSVCVCVFRFFFISLVLWFFSLSAHLYVFCPLVILVCRNLLKTIGQKTQVIIMRVCSLEDALLAKAQVRCHTGANRCLCSYSPISHIPNTAPTKMSVPLAITSYKFVRDW